MFLSLLLLVELLSSIRRHYMSVGKQLRISPRSNEKNKKSTSKIRESFSLLKALILYQHPVDLLKCFKLY